MVRFMFLDYMSFSDILTSALFLHHSERLHEGQNSIFELKVSYHTQLSSLIRESLLKA